MLKLLRAEILKLKRSPMIPVSLAGAAVTPLIIWLGYLLYSTGSADSLPDLAHFLQETDFYVVLLIGCPLYGVLAAYLYNREFAEGTMKSLLAIPVSRDALVVGKYLVLLLWMLALSVFSWAVGWALAALAGFPGSGATPALALLPAFLSGGFFAWLLMTPIVYATLLFRDYVPVIVCAVAITLASVVLSNSRFRFYYPWTAAFFLSARGFRPEIPPVGAYVAVFGTAAAGLVASLARFRRLDVR